MSISDTVTLIANSEAAFEASVIEARAMWKEKRYLRMRLSTCKNRTLDQNALWPTLYKRISETSGDGSAANIGEVRAYCKLIIGVPILRRDDEQFEKGWNRYFASRSYEEQIYLMSPNPLFGVDGFPVTRLLSTKQGAEYTNEIDRHYAPHGVYFGDLLSERKSKNK